MVCRYCLSKPVHTVLNSQQLLPPTTLLINSNSELLKPAFLAATNPRLAKEEQLLQLFDWFLQNDLTGFLRLIKNASKTIINEKNRSLISKILKIYGQQALSLGEFLLKSRHKQEFLLGCEIFKNFLSPRDYLRKMMLTLPKLTKGYQKLILADHVWLNVFLGRAFKLSVKEEPNSFEEIKKEVTIFLEQFLSPADVQRIITPWLPTPSLSTYHFTGQEDEAFYREFCADHNFETIVRTLDLCSDFKAFQLLAKVLQEKMRKTFNPSRDYAEQARLMSSLLNRAEFPNPTAVTDIADVLVNGYAPAADYIFYSEQQFDFLDRVPPATLASVLAIIPFKPPPIQLKNLIPLLANKITPTHLPAGAAAAILDNFLVEVQSKDAFTWEDKITLPVAIAHYYLRQNDFDQTKKYLQKTLEMLKERGEVLYCQGVSFSEPEYQPLLEELYQEINQQSTANYQDYGGLWQLAKAGADWSLLTALWQNHLSEMAACEKQFNFFYPREKPDNAYYQHLLNLLQTPVNKSNNSHRNKIADVFLLRSLNAHRNYLTKENQQQWQALLLQELTTRKLSQGERSKYWLALFNLSLTTSGYRPAIQKAKEVALHASQYPRKVVIAAIEYLADSGAK